jgi:glycosyltransferase involved in cell wall biosynthesis
MRREYDFVYLTNTPSFYKLNLCQLIAERGCSVLLVLYGYGSEAVNTSLERDGNWAFDYEFINRGDSNARFKWATFWRLLSLMRHIKASRVIFAGWLAAEYNIYSLISRRRRNLMVVESSAYESSLSGLKGWAKRLIIGRMSGALPSGKPQLELLRTARFKGATQITGSVGVFNMGSRPALHPTPTASPRYIYVGRLIECKNLRFLVEQFNANGRQLTIVGKGELEAELKAMARDNISFVGFIDNDRLGEVYQAHDIFILPSLTEPWGLVVEEAIYWGLPVVVSDRVGSNIDMVEELATGVIFKHSDGADLERALTQIESSYSQYANAVANVDFARRVNAQVEAYLKLK